MPLPGLRSYFSQLLPSHTPPITDQNLPDLSNKTVLITGGATGLGLALTTLFYLANAHIIIASRSSSIAATAIRDLKHAHPSQSGTLTYIPLDLANLDSIRTFPTRLTAHTQSLHVVINNAGIASQPAGATTPTGLERCIAVNCVGPWLLTQHLLPIIHRTAATAPSNSVRVIYISSLLSDLMAPTGGISIPELSTPSTNSTRNYAISKAGCMFLASELARREQGIVSLSVNPGNLKTAVWDNTGLFGTLLRPLLYEAKLGACGVMWAAVSEDVGEGDSGRCAVPWGRWHPGVRKDIAKAMKLKEEGGTGEAGVFWEWCREVSAGFLPGEGGDGGAAAEEVNKEPAEVAV